MCGPRGMPAIVYRRTAAICMRLPGMTHARQPAPAPMVADAGSGADKEGCSRADMDKDAPVDYYEALQISASAEPETVHRVYRMLAQRFHPDNKETGNATRFRLVSEAYGVLSSPEKRARYDVVHQQRQQDRWRLVSKGAEVENDFGMEQLVRLTVLEVLYTRRRVEPGAAADKPARAGAAERLDHQLQPVRERRMG